MITRTFGKSRDDTRHRFGQDQRAAERQRTDGHDTLDAAVQRGDVVGDVPQFVQRAPHMKQKRLTVGREQQAARMPMEQRETRAVFENPDRAADGRLRDAERARRWAYADAAQASRTAGAAAC